METLTGGVRSDHFIFADGATLRGNIDGRGGIDTLHFSAYQQGNTVNLGRGYSSAEMCIRDRG